MPIYEYRCTSCRAELEKLQKINDAPLVECPECGKDTLVKLISASSFRLKGSGWYETDFKTGNKKNGAAEEKAEKTATDSGSATADAGNKAATKDADGKSGAGTAAKESDSSKGEAVKGTASSEAKGTAKTAEAKGNTQTKPSQGN